MKKSFHKHNLITAFTRNTGDDKEANSFKVDSPENQTLDRPRAREVPVFCTCPTRVNVALVAMGGSMHGLISTRTDGKNAHAMLRTHGSDQARDLRATCTH